MGRNDVIIKDGVLVEWRRADREIVIPDGVRIIGRNSIPKGVEKVVIPESVTTIAEGAFCDCYLLSSIVIPHNVTKIGHTAFMDCENLRSIKIENEAVQIGPSAFSGCRNYADANGYLIVSNILFDYYGNEENVVIPDGVTTIDQYAFNDCDCVKSIVLPESATKICDYAFQFATNLERVTLGASVQEIGEDLFDFGANVTICAPAGSYAEQYANEMGMLIVVEGKAEVATNKTKDFVVDNGVLIEYKGHSKNVVIPDEVTSIGDRAFADKHFLKTVIIPDHVQKIGWAAFANCWELECVNLPERLTHMPGLAFRFCKSLKTITIPEHVVDLGARTFEGCVALTGTVVIPKSVTSIDINTFADCAALEAVLGGENIKYIHEGAFLRCNNLKKIIVPQTVELIGKKAFYGCVALEEVVFHRETKATVDIEAFALCHRIKDVVMPSGIQIKDSSFPTTARFCLADDFYISKDKRSAILAQQLPIKTAQEYAYAWLYQSGKAWQEYLQKTVIDAEAVLDVMADLLCADKKVKAAVLKNLVSFLDYNKETISNAARQLFTEKLSVKHKELLEQLG